MKTFTQASPEVSDAFCKGYQLMTSERPPYDSSSVGMAFRCGEICRERGIMAGEISPSRGYSWIVNRTFRIKFLNDTPGRKGAYSLERIS